MSLNPKVLMPRRIIVLTCALFVAIFGRAEHIQFSKPAVPLAAPAKEKEKLSQDRSKVLDFGDPGIDQPVVVQPQIIRIRPRDSKGDKDDEDSVDPREPRDPVDPSEKFIRKDKKEKLLVRKKDGPNQSRRDDDPKTKGLDVFPLDDSQSQSLSPVTDFNLDERDAGKRSRESMFADRGATNRMSASGPGFLMKREDRDREFDKFEPKAFFDVLVGRSKETDNEKPSREVLERRAAFERLLNPNAGMATKTPGSFEPVTALDAPKALMPLTVPSIIGGNNDTKPVEPLPTAGFQQARLRPPTLDGIAGKNGKSFDSAAPPVFDPAPQSPLIRQPGTRDFPTRKF